MLPFHRLWTGKIRASAWVALLPTLVLAVGCQSPNDVAMRVGQPSKAAVAVREAQTRTISAPDQVSALSNVTQGLQDLGFTIQESSAELGVVTGSKQRDATETGQVAGQIALTVAFALLGTRPVAKVLPG